MTIKTNSVTNKVYAELDAIVELSKTDKALLAGGWGLPSWLTNLLSPRPQIKFMPTVSMPSRFDPGVGAFLNNTNPLTQGAALTNSAPRPTSGFSLWGIRLWS